MTYIPHTKPDIDKMKQTIGINGIDELFADIPKKIFAPKIDIPGSNEIDLTKKLETIANKNIYRNLTSFLGAGAYNHYIPPVVNEIISRNEFYTAYTPYQPEMSQGILQAIFEFQTMICELTGLPVSNASLYDGATAIAEAILLSIRATRRRGIIVCEPINPLYKSIIETYANATNFTVTYINEIKALSLTPDVAAVIIQYPNFLGAIEDLSDIGQTIKENKSLFICACNPIALALFETPATFGADIIVGEGQPLGIPLSFGGPYLGFMSVTEKLLRQIPGRIVGQTIDKNGKTGYVLTIQTREQHIRREKATSNICSNQALMALAASVYLAYMGKVGLNKIANICYNKCLELKKSINEIEGFKVDLDAINFNEFVVKTTLPAQKLLDQALDYNLVPGLKIDENKILVCVTENVGDNNIEVLLKVLANTNSEIKQSLPDLIG